MSQDPRLTLVLDVNEKAAQARIKAFYASLKVEQGQELGALLAGRVKFEQDEIRIATAAARAKTAIEEARAKATVRTNEQVLASASRAAAAHQNLLTAEERTATQVARTLAIEAQALKETERARLASAQANLADARARKIADDAARKQADGLERLKKVAGGVSTAGGILTKAVTVPTVAAAGYGVKVALEREATFANATKYVGGSVAEQTKLNEDLRGLSLDRVVNTDYKKLVGIAAEGGQRGIPIGDLKEYVRAVALLGQTTDVTMEKGAEGLGKIANALKLPNSEFVKMASALVAVNAAGASSSSEVLEVAKRFAGSAREYKMSVPDIFSVANVLVSLGQQQESAGNALTRIWDRTGQAVAKNGKELRLFASVSGLTAKQFKDAWERDALGTVAQFTKNLDSLKDKGLKNQIVADLYGTGKKTGVQDLQAVRSLAAGFDLLTKSREATNKANADGTLLEETAAKSANTAKRDFEQLKRELDDTANTLGTALIPALRDALKATEPVRTGIADLAKSFHDMEPDAQRAWLAVGVAATLAGPFMVAVGQMITTVLSLRDAYLALSVAQQGTVLAAPGKALAIGAAAATGWKIGDYLEKHFQISEKYGQKLDAKQNALLGDSVKKEADNVLPYLRNLRASIANPESGGAGVFPSSEAQVRTRETLDAFAAKDAAKYNFQTPEAADRQFISRIDGLIKMYEGQLRSRPNPAAIAASRAVSASVGLGGGSGAGVGVGGSNPVDEAAVRAAEAAARAKRDAAADKAKRERERAEREAREATAEAARIAAQSAGKRFDGSVRFFEQNGAPLSDKTRGDLLARVNQRQEAYLKARAEEYDAAARVRGDANSAKVRQARQALLQDEREKSDKQIADAEKAVREKRAQAEARNAEQRAKNAQIEFDIKEQSIAAEQTALRFILDDTADWEHRKNLRASLLDLEKQRLETEKNAANAAVAKEEANQRRENAGKGFFEADHKTGALTPEQAAEFELRRRQNNSRYRFGSYQAEKETQQGDRRDERDQETQKSSNLRTSSEQATSLEARLWLLGEAQKHERSGMGPLTEEQERALTARFAQETDKAHYEGALSEARQNLSAAVQSGKQTDLAEAFRLFDSARLHTDGVGGQAGAISSELSELTNASQAGGGALLRGEAGPLLLRRLRELRTDSQGLGQVDLTEQIDRSLETFKDGMDGAAARFGKTVLSSLQNAEHALLEDILTGKGGGKRFERFGQDALRSIASDAAGEMSDRFTRSAKNRLSELFRNAQGGFAGLFKGAEMSAERIAAIGFSMMSAIQALTSKNSGNALLGGVLGGAVGSLIPGIGLMGGIGIGTNLAVHNYAGVLSSAIGSGAFGQFTGGSSGGGGGSGGGNGSVYGHFSVPAGRAEGASAGVPAVSYSRIHIGDVYDRTDAAREDQRAIDEINGLLSRK